MIRGTLPPPSELTPPFAKIGNAIPLAIGFLLMIAGIALSRRERYRRT